jgi:hypothetical protein
MTEQTQPSAETQPSTEVAVKPQEVPQGQQQNQIQVNIDYLRTTRVHICMPCYGGQLQNQLL